MDLPSSLFERCPTDRKYRKEGKEIPQLLNPHGHPGNAKVDLLSRRGSPLVHQPERVPEPSPCLRLGYDP